MIKGFFIVSFFGLTNLTVFCQDTTKVTNFDPVEIKKNRLFKVQGLYDSYEVDNTPSINGFTQLTVFEDRMSDEVWKSEDKECVDFQLKESGSEKFLNLTWNKDREGCDWVGIGFGWDFWSSKDMGQIVDVAAVEIEVRSKGKTMGNLPWAIGFEDYAGGQAWTGFSKKFVPNGEITADWTKVQVPLALFPFEEYDCDPSNVKQMLIQLFAQDEVEINAIRIVEFKGKLKQDIVSENSNSVTPRVDGNLNEWFEPFVKLENGSSFATMHTNDSLFLAFKVIDGSPRLNNQTKGSLWNGDAIEIAFSTNPIANPKRNLFLLSDYHIGLNCGENPYLWSFSDDEAFNKGSFNIKSTKAGYNVEIGIALKELTKLDLSKIQQLGLEIAIDEGNSTNTRQMQTRWNSSGNEGFHQNPSMWGTLIFD